MDIRLTIDDSELIEVTGIDDADRLQHIVRTVIRDAVYEFSANRGPSPNAYVDNRYPGDSVYSGKSREDKIRQVRQRNRIADLLHTASFTADIS